MEFAGAQIIEQQSALGSLGIFVQTLFDSPLFSVIKIFAAIYVAVLIVDLVLLLILSSVDESYRKTKRGANIPTHAGAMRKWKKIRARLKKGELNYYKAAILEADQMIEKILSDAGYAEATMLEKIQRVESQHISSAQVLREAHEVSVRVIQDPEITLSREETEQVLLKYETFLDDLEIFG